MATTAQETDQITHVIDLYVEGCREGDGAKLREAFHPDSRMWGSLGGQRYDVPIADMIAMVDGQPVDVEGSYEARVTSVEQTDDAVLRLGFRKTPAIEELIGGGDVCRLQQRQKHQAFQHKLGSIAKPIKLSGSTPYHVSGFFVLAFSRNRH